MRKILLPTALITLLSCCLPAQATDVGFSIGTGYPYFGSLELSLPADKGQQRWFANYKMGFDDGFSLGFEQSYGKGLNHAFGGLVGAVGVYKDGGCDDSPTSNTDSSSDAFRKTLACGIGTIFDDHTLNGLGVSYSYYVNGINQSGWRFKFEAGYGKASTINEKRATGGFIASYQF